MEGNHCFGASSCNQTGLVRPIAEYAHGADGCSVTVRWKKAGELTATQALRKALKALQEQEAKGRGEAA